MKHSTETIYQGPYWAFISDTTGMPLEIRKCTFEPTVLPQRDGTWVELHRARGLLQISGAYARGRADALAEQCGHEREACRQCESEEKFRSVVPTKKEKKA